MLLRQLRCDTSKMHVQSLQSFWGVPGVIKLQIQPGPLMPDPRAFRFSRSSKEDDITASHLEKEITVRIDEIPDLESPGRFRGPANPANPAAARGHGCGARSLPVAAADLSPSGRGFASSIQC